MPMPTFSVKADEFPKETLWFLTFVRMEYVNVAFNLVIEEKASYSLADLTNDVRLSVSPISFITMQFSAKM